MIYLNNTFEIECPCCKEKIILLYENNNLKIVSSDISETELFEVLKEMNIEFG